MGGRLLLTAFLKKAYIHDGEKQEYDLSQILLDRQRCLPIARQRSYLISEGLISGLWLTWSLFALSFLLVEMLTLQTLSKGG